MLPPESPGTWQSNLLEELFGTQDKSIPAPQQHNLKYLLHNGNIKFGDKGTYVKLPELRHETPSTRTFVYTNPGCLIFVPLFASFIVPLLATYSQWEEDFSCTIESVNANGKFNAFHHALKEYYYSTINPDADPSEKRLDSEELLKYFGFSSTNASSLANQINEFNSKRRSTSDIVQSATRCRQLVDFFQPALCQKELHYLVFRPLAIRNPNLSETDPELADLIEKKHARGEVVGFNVDVGGIYTCQSGETIVRVFFS